MGPFGPCVVAYTLPGLGLPCIMPKPMPMAGKECCCRWCAAPMPCPGRPPRPVGEPEARGGVWACGGVAVPNAYMPGAAVMTGYPDRDRPGMLKKAAADVAAVVAAEEDGAPASPLAPEACARPVAVVL